MNTYLQRKNNHTYKEQKKIKSLNNRLSKVESQINSLEKEIKEIDSKLEANYDKVASNPDFFDSYQKKKSDLQELMQSWEAIQLEIEYFNES